MNLKNSTRFQKYYLTTQNTLPFRFALKSTHSETLFSKWKLIGFTIFVNVLIIMFIGVATLTSTKTKTVLECQTVEASKVKDLVHTKSILIDFFFHVKMLASIIVIYFYFHVKGLIYVFFSYQSTLGKVFWTTSIILVK
jgi:hypothetical protein